MAVFRSLRTPKKKSRTFLTASVSPISSSPPRSHLSNWILIPSSHGPHTGGPLFLSFPPWKLSQSATPLSLRGNAAVLEKIEALNLNLNLLRNKRKRKKTSPPELTAAGSGRKGSDDFVNLPNLISMARMVSGPVIGWMIVNEWYSAAMAALAVSGASDWLDGYVARRMRINSVVGSYLDPLADKVLIGCVALAMVHKDLLHPGLVGFIVVRDVALVSAAMYQRASSLGWKWKNRSDFFNLDATPPPKVKPLFISKVNTVFQLVLVAAALLQPEFGTLETQPYVMYSSWLVASTTLASSAAYGAQHFRNSASIARKC